MNPKARNILNSIKLKIFITTNLTRYLSALPTNVIGHYENKDKTQEPGVIYDNKPFKLPLKAGKKYAWCLCGRSKTQPFCDGTHNRRELRIKQKPILFIVEEDKDYWLCNCKQTKHRPFCDGTHKTETVVDAPTTVR